MEGLEVGRLDWTIQMGPKCSHRCLFRGRPRERFGPRRMGGGSVTSQVEAGDPRPQARSWKTQGVDSPQGPPPPTSPLAQ